MQVDLYFGFVDLLSFKKGDLYHFSKEGSASGAQEKGIDGIQTDAYTECPLCQKDFFLKVLIENGRLASVGPDSSRHGNIPD